jgi:hypothetical protein
MLKIPMLVRRALLVLMVLGASPTPASAQFIEFIEWLDRLSGPAFHGFLVDFPLACKPQGEGGIQRGDCSPTDAEGGRLRQGDRRFVFGARFGRHVSDVSGDDPANNFRYPAGTREEDKGISQYTFGGSITWQVHKAFDIVGAIEASRFGGPLVNDFTIGTISPGVVIKPLALFSDSRAARLLKIPLRAKTYLGTMTGEQFGAVPGFVSERETIFGWGLAIDWVFSGRW